VKIFGPVDDNVRAQIARCQDAEPGAQAVLCADNHLGYSMPIGGVIAYEGLVSPSAVGYDIACGNLAVRTDARVADVDVKRVMDDVWRAVSFGVGRKNAERVEHPVLDAIAASPVTFQRPLAQMAAEQLGTVGSGNHYVDLFADDEGWLWIGVHFGSRGFGHKTATWTLEQLGRTDDSMDAPPAVIPIASELGQAYIEGMRIAGDYAYAGREWVVGKVLRILGASQVDSVHNHHNFAWRESHGGRDVWVHRKGATPAYPYQRGFVGGTMGENAVILQGVESPDAAAALYSTVHGAGRAISRRQATGKTKQAWTCRNYRVCDGFVTLFDDKGQRIVDPPKCPKCGYKTHKTMRHVQAGLIDWPAAAAEVRAKGIELRGAGGDEAPACYKRLDEVLAHHAGTIEILHTLRPVGVAMAGADVKDPFRD
jgi:tRNA-splicing ligase RtcB (3'-phosphate/5'-hydroxy nucleic acid ligase)